MSKIREVWETIDGHPNYLVSNIGRVKRLAHWAKRTRKNPHGCSTPLYFEDKILNQRLVNGYPTVNFRGGERKSYKVHRLIAIAFIPNPENKPHINHINAIRNDNRIENLEWCTHDENMAHAVRTNLTCKGSKNGQAKLTDEQVLKIRKLFAEGANKSRLSRQFNISRGSIKKAIEKTSWANL